MDGCTLCFRSVVTDAATPESYTLSLHDALPIWRRQEVGAPLRARRRLGLVQTAARRRANLRSATRRGRLALGRSEEHTSELQSRGHLVCRLLLEKKKTRQRDFNDRH